LSATAANRDCVCGAACERDQCVTNIRAEAACTATTAGNVVGRTATTAATYDEILNLKRAARKQ